MYTRRSGLLIGFHGCDKEIQQQILKGEISDLKPSNNPWDWLGHGIYFWENNPERALHFAIEQAERKSEIKEPAVIGAVIDLGYCLDLMDKANLELVRENYSMLKATFDKLGKPMPVNKSPSNEKSTDLLFRNLDRLVINTLNIEQDEIKPFETVRGIFTEGNPLYPNAGFREKDHVQICVRNTNCIKGYFLPKKFKN